MRLVPWSKYWPEAFVFDDAHVLEFSDDSMIISRFDPRSVSKPEITEVKIQQCPRIEVGAIGRLTMRALVKLGQFNVTLTGPNVGTVKHNDGYSVAADGAYWRKIRSAAVAGELTKSALALSVAINADPVDTLVRSQPPGALSDRDREPFAFSYTFDIPADRVPELLDMARTERHRFLTQLESMEA
jgi:hypothetical protein